MVPPDKQRDWLRRWNYDCCAERKYSNVGIKSTNT